MVHKALFWGAFGAAVRLWQLGIELRPFFHSTSLWAYPIYIGCGAGFGYWLEGVEQRQTAFLTERKQMLLDKRQKRAGRDASAAGGSTTAANAS